MDLPRDLPKGPYPAHCPPMLIVTWQDYQRADRSDLRRKVDDVFLVSVLHVWPGFATTALYVRLVRQPDGVRSGLNEPAAASVRRRRQSLRGRRDAVHTAFVKLTVKVIPTDDVMSGSAEFGHHHRHEP